MKTCAPLPEDEPSTERPICALCDSPIVRGGCACYFDRDDESPEQED